MNPKELKAKSESIIKGFGLEANPALPLIEDIEQIKLREASDIARRILVLGYLYGISFNVKRSKIKGDLKRYGLYNDLSPHEQKVLSSLFLSKQARTDVDWVTEGIEVLGWAIGLWEEVSPLGPCNEDRQADVVALKQDPSDFINNARLIEVEKILQQADLIYRLHWVVKRAEVSSLGEFSNDIYKERHKAINWIIGIEECWDEIRTDT